MLKLYHQNKYYKINLSHIIWKVNDMDKYVKIKNGSSTEERD